MNLMDGLDRLVEAAGDDADLPIDPGVMVLVLARLMMVAEEAPPAQSAMPTLFEEPT